MPTHPQRQRNVLAATLKHHPPTSPEAIEARRELTAVKAESYIARLVAAAPPLSAEQRSRLAVLLLSGAA